MFKKLIAATLFVMCLFAPLTAQAQTIARGSFKGVSIKWSAGSVSIVKTAKGNEIRLGSNFKTKKGPALYVYLGNGKPEKRVAKLKAVEGAQSYIVPSRVDVGDYSKVFIYCVPFNAVFAAARVR